MFPIIIGIYMFIGVLVPALVQSAMEFVKETLVTSGLSHEAQCALGLLIVAIGAPLATLGLGSVLYIVNHRPDD